MRLTTPMSRQAAFARGILFVAVLGLAPSMLRAVDAPATDGQKANEVQRNKPGRGKFVSFKDGTLVIAVNSGASIEYDISTTTKAFVWNYDEGKFQPMDTAEALKLAKAGTWFVVGVSNANVTIHVGARKAQTVGTFVSFKENRLRILGKNLGESYVKKYGNNLHFNPFREDVPVYESVDGGDYARVEGKPSTILSNVKEGTILTIHGEGDDNITLIQIGVPKKK